jgi:hypothetical protein
MFESLTDKLQGIFARIRGASRLDEKTVDEVLREIRLALLEADVNFRVVKDFIARIREQAIGEEVLKSLTPDQQVIRIVRDELICVVGGRGGADTLGSTPADGVYALRLARLGQDDDLREARTLGEIAGAQPAAGGVRPATPRRYQTAGGAGATGWRARVHPAASGHARPREYRTARTGLRPHARLRCADCGHGRTPTSRRAADGRVATDARRAAAPRSAAGGRRHHGARGGQCRESVPRAAGTDGRHYEQDGRRRARRRDALGQGGRRQARALYRRRRTHRRPRTVLPRP